MIIKQNLIFENNYLIHECYPKIHKNDLLDAITEFNRKSNTDGYFASPSQTVIHFKYDKVSHKVIYLKLDDQDNLIANVEPYNTPNGQVLKLFEMNGTECLLRISLAALIQPESLKMNIIRLDITHA